MALWMKAIGRYQAEWDEQRDRPRIVEAFNRVTESMDHWPAPADFLAAIPESLVKREYFQALPRPKLSPEEETKERERRQRIVAAEWEKLGWKRKDETDA